MFVEFQGGLEIGVFNMRSFAKMAVVAAALTVATSGTALAQPEAINITISPKFAHQVEKLGEREVDDQIADLTRELNRTLERRGALQGATLDLVITDLKPNRPTMQQMVDRPGLDPIRSLSVGGAAFEGTVTTADGVKHAVKYDYYSPTIYDSLGSATWADANRAYLRFATNLANGRFVTR